MQPNQQDLSQPTPPPQQNYSGGFSNVPDYLHLDPVLGPQAKKPSKKPLIIIAVVVLFLVIGGGVAIFFALQGQQLTPTQRFYTALGNLAQTTYVERKISIDSQNPSLQGTVTIDSDFSKGGKPAESADYKLAQAGSQDASGSIVAVGSDSPLVKVTQKLLAIPDEKTLQSGKWYALSTVSSTIATGHQQLYGALGIYTATAKAPPYLYLGHISDSNLTSLMNLLVTNSIYTLKDSHEDTVNGAQAVVYDATINMQQLGKIGGQIATLLGEKQFTSVLYNQVDSVSAQFAVDKATNKLLSVKDTAKQTTGGATVSTGVSFSYPTAPQVEQPSSPLNISG